MSSIGREAVVAKSVWMAAIWPQSPKSCRSAALNFPAIGTPWFVPQKRS